MKAATLVVFQFKGKEWVPLLPADTPEWVKTPEVMGDLVAGAIVERDNEFFRAHRLGDSPLLLPHTPNLKHKPAVLAKVMH